MFTSCAVTPDQTYNIKMRCSFVPIVACFVLCVALVEGSEINSNQGERGKGRTA